MRDWRTDPVRLAKCFVFMHVPKTGGTTFTQQVRRSIHHDQVLLYNPVGPGKMPEDARPTWVAGHTPFSWYKFHADSEDWFALIRDPVERVRSHLRHLLDRGMVPRSQLRHTIGEPRFRNMQTRMFSAIALGPEYEKEEACIERALEGMRLFAHVGDTGRYEEFEERVAVLSGLKLQVAPRHNTSQSELDIAEFEDDIRRHNSLDQRLYDEARVVFEWEK